MVLFLVFFWKSLWEHGVLITSTPVNKKVNKIPFTLIFNVYEVSKSPSIRGVKEVLEVLKRRIWTIKHYLLQNRFRGVKHCMSDFWAMRGQFWATINSYLEKADMAPIKQLYGHLDCAKQWTRRGSSLCFKGLQSHRGLGCKQVFTT